MNRCLVFLSVGLCLLSTVAGCNRDGLTLVKSTGQVTYKGKPLQGANIKFIPGSGPMAIAITDEEGGFVITTNGRPGATVGLHKVAITKITGSSAPTASPKPEDMMKMQKENMGKAKSGPKNEIPEKYSNPESSGLSAEVTTNPSENAFLFQLQ